MLKKLFRPFAIITAGVLMVSLMHPYYVGVAEIKCQPDKSLNCSIKLFTDNLETELKNEYQININLIKPANRKSTEQLLGIYLKKHFELQQNNQAISLTFLGFEIEDDATWCYLEGKLISPNSELGISNSLLYDQFPSQINIVHFEQNGKRQSAKVQNPNRNLSFNVN